MGETPVDKIKALEAFAINLSLTGGTKLEELQNPEDLKTIELMAMAMYIADGRGSLRNWQNEVKQLEAHESGYTPEWGEKPHYMILATAAFAVIKLNN